MATARRGSPVRRAGAPLIRELIIVAAGGLTRELLAPLRATGRYCPVGILDDDPDRAGVSLRGVPVLGPVEQIKAHPAPAVLVAIGRGRTRHEVVERLADLGVVEGRYATVIDPSVTVPRSCVIGPGSIILAGTVLTADVTVGRHVVIMPNVTLTHDDVVEDFATLCAGASLGGGVRIGSAAYLGMNAAVREQRVVGAGAVIGMGAAVITDVPDDEVWAGVPARRLDGRAPW